MPQLSRLQLTRVRRRWSPEANAPPGQKLLTSPPLRLSGLPLNKSRPNPGPNPLQISPLVPPLRRPYGRGPAVSAFTLGTMRALASPAQMQAVVRAALAAGINHLETAPAYGPAERFLGQALQNLAREGQEPPGGWLITSKLLPGCDLASGQEQLRAILNRLGVPALTTLAVHGLNLNEHLSWALQGAGAELLAWALGEGLVGQVGFTSHGDRGLIERALASGRFSVCGLHLHLLDRQRLPLARQALSEGIGVLAISPADKGGQLYAPPAELEADCAPFHPLELAYRFLQQQGISTLSLGAERPEDLIWAERLSDPGPPSPLPAQTSPPARSPATAAPGPAGLAGIAADREHEDVAPRRAVADGADPGNLRLCARPGGKLVGDLGVAEVMAPKHATPDEQKRCTRVQALAPEIGICPVQVQVGTHLEPLRCTARKWRRQALQLPRLPVGPRL
jgi:diketogulonate reductase-like aldo/keto reductase